MAKETRRFQTKLIAPGLFRAYVRRKVDQQTVVGEAQHSS